jgi:hypothetical protein
MCGLCPQSQSTLSLNRINSILWLVFIIKPFTTKFSATADSPTDQIVFSSFLNEWNQVPSSYGTKNCDLRAWRRVRIPPPRPCESQEAKKWCPVPGDITGPPCHLGTYIRNAVLQVIHWAYGWWLCFVKTISAATSKKVQTGWSHSQELTHLADSSKQDSDLVGPCNSVHRPAL